MIENINSFGPGPGKTAPRLLEDLKEYMPVLDGANPLVDFPVPYYTTQPPVDKFPPPKHRHSLVLKDAQCTPFTGDMPPPHAWRTVHTVALMCRTCRCHFKLSLNHESEPVMPCNHDNKDYPLHHLQYSRAESSLKLAPIARDHHVFRCSNNLCRAVLCIEGKAPVISENEIRHFTDKVRREQWARSQKEIMQPGESPPTIGTVLDTIWQYMANVRIKKDSRPIPRKNRRLQLSLGNDADALFERCGFTLCEDTPSEMGTWNPPDVTGEASNEFWCQIDDVMEELKLIAVKYSPQFIPPDVNKSGDREAKKLLSCVKFDTRSPYALNYTSDNKSNHPRYANLGALGEFSDSLIEWCYKTQCSRDPDNGPYYLECLIDLAKGRNSNDLQMAAMLAKSNGDFSSSDVREAYRALHLDPNREYEDSVIIGHFRAFIADAPRQEAQMRHNLNMIGTALRSQAIVHAAQNIMTTAAQAYEYFDVSGGNPEDDYVLTMFQMKIRDSPGDQEVATEALRLIAEDRNSNIIRKFLEFGILEDRPLDIDLAYARLDIPRDGQYSDDMIIGVYNVRVADGATNVDDLQTALKIIGEDRNSAFIRNFLGSGNLTTEGRTDWPVGLENIGNTCYLNSLLQYYFTITPLRELILDFDRYEESASETVLATKRVGGRLITLAEIERAKNFARCLRDLFNNMINSSESSVTPEYDLAYLALVSSKDEANVKEDKDVQPAQTADEVIVMDDSMDIDSHENQDGRSETTLVDKTEVNKEDGDFVMVDESKKDDEAILEDKENLPPYVETVEGTIPIRPVLQDVTTSVETAGPLTPPPNRNTPPPIPPRPLPKPPVEEEKSKNVNLMFGRQQDVAECIENVMFQIEAAVQPSDIDENGEQIDLVKKLFYGRTKQTLVDEVSHEARTKIELFSHLIVNVANGASGIYDALDNAFEDARVMLEDKWTNRSLIIDTLPPVLQIQVQRVQFDRTTNRAYKSTAHLEFPEVLYMDRYLDSDDAELVQKRVEVAQWRSELAELEKSISDINSGIANLNPTEAIDSLQDWVTVGRDGKEKDLVQELSASRFETQVTDIKTSIEQERTVIENRMTQLKAHLTSQFANHKKHGYRIHSVFIHRGSAAFGHYWIYIYDFVSNMWRKYNDGYVTQVDDVSEVFKQEDTNPATPYFLVYVKEDQTHMMESVKRAVV